MTDDRADPLGSKNICFSSYTGKPLSAPRDTATATSSDSDATELQFERERTRTAGLVLRLAGRLRAARRDGRAARPGYDLGHHIVLLRALRTAAAVLRARDRTGG